MLALYYLMNFFVTVFINFAFSFSFLEINKTKNLLELNVLNFFVLHVIHQMYQIWAFRYVFLFYIYVMLYNLLGIFLSYNHFEKIYRVDVPEKTINSMLFLTIGISQIACKAVAVRVRWFKASPKNLWWCQQLFSKKQANGKTFFLFF